MRDFGISIAILGAGLIGIVGGFFIASILGLYCRW